MDDDCYPYDSGNLHILAVIVVIEQHAPTDQHPRPRHSLFKILFKESAQKIFRSFSVDGW